MFNLFFNSNNNELNNLKNKKIDENVIICGIVKNVQVHIRKSLEFCIKTGEMFNDYKIVIYENNSVDGTKNILKNYEKEMNNHFKIICEDLDKDEIKNKSRCWAYTKITGSDHPCRIEQISNARNKVISEIRKEEYNKYTYVIWIDLDTNYYCVDGILDSFNKRQKCNWDVVYANGLEKNLVNYYDKYAYRDEKNFLFGPEVIGEHFWNLVKHNNISFVGNNDLIPIISGFGGIGIFKKDIFNKYNYDCIVSDSIIKYYSNLLNKVNIDKHLDEVISNPCKKFPGGYKSLYKIKKEGNEEIKWIHWKNNCGYDNVIICEHVHLNLTLINDGYKLFINPKMIYIWNN